MASSSVSGKIRKEVYIRANGFCEYCRADSKYADSPFDVEHITPLSKGGKSELDNLALACHGCNMFKSNRIEFFDAATGKTVKLFNPRNDVRDEHFSWTSDYAEIVGLTAIGRATVEALNLNRAGLINQRRMLHQYGAHP
jgi:hypothetical protein